MVLHVAERRPTNEATPVLRGGVGTVLIGTCKGRVTSCILIYSEGGGLLMWVAAAGDGGGDSKEE